MNYAKTKIDKRSIKISNIQIFDNNDFGTVRTIEEDGKVLFCGADVAKALGYKWPKDAIAAHCKGAAKRPILTNGGTQELTFIPEGDVYRLIARSKLPSAEQFERWVFDEVLPNIRKHGAYMTPETLEAAILNPDTLIQLCNQLKNEMEKNHRLEAKVKHDKPKVLFAEAVSTSKTSILIGELAKILKQNGIDTGEKRLFQWLRDNGYLIRRKGTDYNAPTQRSMDLGLFEVKETAVTHSDGHVSVNKTTKVTGKGQQYFINLFMEKKAG